MMRALAFGRKLLCVTGGEQVRRKRMLAGPPCGVTRSDGDGAIGRYHVLDVAFRGSLRVLAQAVYGVQGQPARRCHRAAPGFWPDTDVDRPGQ